MTSRLSEMTKEAKRHLLGKEARALWSERRKTPTKGKVSKVAI